MSNGWRRFGVRWFNDGRDVPPDWLAEAVLEIVDRFSAASYETQKVEGSLALRRHPVSSDIVRIVVDVPDSTKNREWMKGFKNRWRSRLEQHELWMVKLSYRG